MKEKKGHEVQSQVEKMLAGVSVEEFTRSAFEQMVRAEAVRYALSVMGEEVQRLCGKAHERKKHGGLAHRGGSESGSIVIGGHREKVVRPRVRSERGEIRLETYEALHTYEGLGDFVSRLMLSGISTRGYQHSISEHVESLGLSKSEASRQFIAESREALNEINIRRFPDTIFWAILVDGLHVCDEVIVVAMGVDVSGNKHFLGISQGSTENTEVVNGLLSSIVDRNIKFTDKVLAVIDGGKALRRALTDHFGDKVSIQRCLIHKKRNVIARLAKKHRGEFSAKLSVAYNCNDLSTAHCELEKVVKWLENINHNAAESLQEGMEDLLTLHRLQMPPALRISFYTTNLIESAFANPRDGINRVKRWRKNTDMIKRWLGAHLLAQEKQFRKVKGYKEIGKFLKNFAGTSDFLVDEDDAA